MCLTREKKKKRNYQFDSIILKRNTFKIEKRKKGRFILLPEYSQSSGKFQSHQAFLGTDSIIFLSTDYKLE